MKSALTRAKRSLTDEKLDRPVSLMPAIPRTHTTVFSQPIDIENKAPKDDWRMPSAPANTPESDDGFMMMRY